MYIISIVFAYIISIPYTYKFLRGVNFVDDSNLGFQGLYFRGSLVIAPSASIDCVINFEDFNNLVNMANNHEFL